MDMPAFVWWIVGVDAFFILWLIGTYNRFASLRNTIRESWSGVDVALKRRYDLIPNLVETVKGYAAHEREVFQEVTEARERALSSFGDVASQAADENILVRSLQRLFARVEAYPELKASEQFLALQRELANTEDRIAAARRFYNANVKAYNTALESFPSGMIGRSAGHVPSPYFGVEDIGVRQPVPVGM